MDIIDVFADEACTTRYSEQTDANPNENPISVVLNGTTGDVYEMPIYIKNVSLEHDFFNGTISIDNTGAVTVEFANDNNGTPDTYASGAFNIGDLASGEVKKVWVKFTVPEGTSLAVVDTAISITGTVV